MGGVENILERRRTSVNHKDTKTNTAKAAFDLYWDEISAIHAQARAIAEERRKLIESITDPIMREDARGKNGGILWKPNI